MIKIRILLAGGVRADWPNLSVLLEELKKNKNFEVVLVHTNQHYSNFFDSIFFKDLGIQKPNYFLDIGSGSRGYQTGQTIERMENVLAKEKIDADISFSDANSCLHSITVRKHQIPIIHLESGMRSMDHRMEEEVNRRMIDHISDYLFCPTEEARSNLMLEGILNKKIFISGKLIIDALTKYKRFINYSKALDVYNVDKDDFFVATLHRPENVEDEINLKNLINGLENVYNYYEQKVLAFLHPRTQEAIKRFNIPVSDGIIINNPIGFLDFVKLEQHCICALTDSGTVPEECCWLRKPTVTLRRSTERPETVWCNSSVIAGEPDGTFKPNKILNLTIKQVDRETNWEIPYRQGASKKIVEILKKKENEILKPKVDWND